MRDHTLERLTDFAALLGWRGFRRRQHIVPAADRHLVNGQARIIWCESGSLDDFYFQINELPDWRTCVFAMRYRLYTGWHSFRLHGASKGREQEAQRLERWLHRRLFATIDGRREFRRLHPGFAEYNWSRLRADGQFVHPTNEGLSR